MYWRTERKQRFLRRRFGELVRVLLVEDDADLRTEIREYLQRRGHQVAECGSLSDARIIVRRLIAELTPPQATVCDVNLPDGNGFDFYIADSPGLPDCSWVMMSGAHDFDHVDMVNGQSGLRPCAIIEKPVSLRSLNAALIQR